MKENVLAIRGSPARIEFMSQYWIMYGSLVVTALVMSVQSASAAASNPFPTADRCESPKFWAGTQNVTLEVNGATRIFELYSPWESRGTCGLDSYCTGPPLQPNRGLVLNWHGCNKHYPILDYHTEISRIPGYAQDRGYFTITPLGTKTPEIDGVGGDWGWNADGIPCGTPGTDDFAFFEVCFAFVVWDYFLSHTIIP